VAELEESAERRSKFSRRRPVHEGQGPVAPRHLVKDQSCLTDKSCAKSRFRAYTDPALSWPLLDTRVAWLSRYRFDQRAKPRLQQENQACLRQVLLPLLLSVVSCCVRGPKE
jgi:hypothetical protein